jgi:hypothetical protein
VVFQTVRYPLLPIFFCHGSQLTTPWLSRYEPPKPICSYGLSDAPCSPADRESRLPLHPIACGAISEKDKDGGRISRMQLTWRIKNTWSSGFWAIIIYTASIFIRAVLIFAFALAAKELLRDTFVGDFVRQCNVTYSPRVTNTSPTFFYLMHSRHETETDNSRR